MLRRRDRRDGAADAQAGGGSHAARGFETVEDAARATSAIIASGIVPAALEFMDQATIRSSKSRSMRRDIQPTRRRYFSSKWTAVGAVDADVARVRELCAGCGSRDVRVARDDRERMRLWQGRKKAFGAMGRIAPHLVVQDAVIPRTKLPEILASIRAIGDANGVKVCNVFHAGDGNLHPNITYDANDVEQAKRVHSAMRRSCRRASRPVGASRASMASGSTRSDTWQTLFDEPTLAAMCDLRGAFDPDRRANPGKTIPVHSCREWDAVASVRESGAAAGAR